MFELVVACQVLSNKKVEQKISSFFAAKKMAYFMSFQNGILKKHKIYWWQVIQKIKTFPHYFQHPKISFRVLCTLP